MTPKDKAEELVDKFTDLEDGEMYIGKAKQCALIAVDEIDRVLQSASTKEDPYINLLSLEYWQEVKNEINNL